MTEFFESKFHKDYVGGEGEVKPQELSLMRLIWNQAELPPTTIEEVEEEYRWYMRDPEAKLPSELRNHLLAIGIRTENANG